MAIREIPYSVQGDSRTQGNSRLAGIEKEAILLSVPPRSKQISARLTPEQRSAAARKAALVRWARLTPEQRSAAVRKATLARWAPRLAAGWVAISKEKGLKKGVNYGR